MICSFRWFASRVEVVTTPVEHVCGDEETPSHDIHRCACGAITTDYPGLQKP